MNVACVILKRRIGAIAALVVLTGRLAAAEICVDVNLQFDGRHPSAAVIEPMKAEAAAVWRSYGVQIGWSSNTELDPCAAAQGSLDVLITRRPAPRLTSWRMPLGRTRVVPVIDHVPTHLDQDATERMIASLSRVELLRHLGRPMVEPPDVGRALGRVLAHEIGHVILAAPDHQPQGLMRRSFLPAELIEHHRRTYTLSAEEVARLRRRERELNTRSSRRASLASP